MSSSPGAGDDVGHLLDLGLGTTESSELKREVSTSTKEGEGRRWVRPRTYSLLCELTGALILGVAEKFNDTALVRGETVDQRKYSSARVRRQNLQCICMCVDMGQG